MAKERSKQGEFIYRRRNAEFARWKRRSVVGVSGVDGQFGVGMLPAASIGHTRSRWASGEWIERAGMAQDTAAGTSKPASGGCCKREYYK